MLLLLFIHYLNLILKLRYVRHLYDKKFTVAKSAFNIFCAINCVYEDGLFEKSAFGSGA